VHHQLEGLADAAVGFGYLAAAIDRHQATSSSEELRTTELRSTETRDSVTIELRDTLKEVTTITIDRNDKGDTLKVVQVTDRDRIRDRSQLRDKSEKIIVRVDTVYVERRDSFRVDRGQVTGDSSRPSATRASPFVSALKWVFWIIVAIGALIMGWKVCKVFKFLV
jgi:hypothetical protein